MLVVWLQGVLGAAEQHADIVGVVLAGVEVGIVADLQREVHAHVGQIVQTDGLQGDVRLELLGVGGVDLEDLL